MVGRHHRLDGHEFEQAPGAGDGRGGLACHSPWGCRESDTTEQLSNNKNDKIHTYAHSLVSWAVSLLKSRVDKPTSLVSM